MKPLTIEQLKSLEAGDWVWIVDFSKTVYKPISDSGSYYRIDDSGQCSDKELWCHCSAIGHGFYYSDYGKTWTAFKNKEMAESEEYKIFYNKFRKVWEVRKLRVNYGTFRICYSKEEAERCLTELKEKK